MGIEEISHLHMPSSGGGLIIKIKKRTARAGRLCCLLSGGMLVFFSVDVTFVLSVFLFQMECLYTSSGFLVTHLSVGGPGEQT